MSISIVAILLLVLVKIYVNDKFKKKLKNIPIPTELFVVKYLHNKLLIRFKKITLISSQDYSRYFSFIFWKVERKL